MLIWNLFNIFILHFQKMYFCSSSFFSSYILFSWLPFTIKNKRHYICHTILSMFENVVCWGCFSMPFILWKSMDLAIKYDNLYYSNLCFLMIVCGDGIEYLHYSPVSWWKGNLVPGHLTVPHRDKGDTNIETWFSKLGAGCKAYNLALAWGEEELEKWGGKIKFGRIF
jgi:hypothetical protein